MLSQPYILLFALASGELTRALSTCTGHAAFCEALTLLDLRLKHVFRKQKSCCFGSRSGDLLVPCTLCLSGVHD